MLQILLRLRDPIFCYNDRMSDQPDNSDELHVNQLAKAIVDRATGDKANGSDDKEPVEADDKSA